MITDFELSLLQLKVPVVVPALHTSRFRVKVPQELLSGLDEEHPAGLSASTRFGIVIESGAMLKRGDSVFPLEREMYFCTDTQTELIGDGKVILIDHPGWQGLFQIGGPVEQQGRLRYIDGCTDTVLVAPVRKGDPCLNLLHLPAGISQSRHTHPSIRIGVVLSGTGTCQTGLHDLPLKPGSLFVLPADAIHAFHTQADELRIIAYHPDSDTGPSDASHPMLNRTIVGGRPANELRSESLA